MNQNEMISNLLVQFEKSAQAFCEENNGIFFQFSEEYKGAELPQNLKQKTAKVFFNAFVVEFVYTAHGFMGTVNSILSCNVYLDKAENSVGIPLPMMSDYCGMDVCEPLCIPFITNAMAMEQAFCCLSTVLHSILPQIAKICVDAVLLEQVRGKFCTEFYSIFEVDLFDLVLEQQRRILSDFLVNRFYCGAFLHALRGNYTKAAKELEKIKVLTGYEKRMLMLWRRKCESNADLSAVKQNAQAFSVTGTSKTERREFAAAFVGWITMCPAFSAVYLALYALVVWIIGWNSVYLMGAMYNFPYCIMAGFVTAIGASYFTRFFFYKRLFKKTYVQYCEMEGIRNLNSDHKVMRGFLTILIVASLALTVLMANWNLNFLQDGFMDNTKFLSLQGEYHSYSEIEYVYYKPNRVNGHGETLEYPSYVIVLKDGQEIDLYEHGEISDYSEQLLDFFREKGIEIR